MEKQNPMLFSRRDLIRILIPLAMQGILSVFIGMADSMMVSNKGEDAFAGVSLVGSLDTVLITLFGALTAGGSVVLAQAMGRGDRNHACNAAKQLIYASAICASVITVSVLVFRVPLLRLLFGDVEESVMRNALSYFTIVALSFPMLAIENSISAAFRAEGDSITTLKTSLFMNVLNICGNALLIYGLDLGAAGAALATLFSRIIGASILLWLAHDKKRFIHIEKILHYKPDFAVIKDILGIGVPNGIENSMFQLGRLMTTSLVSSLGTVAIAANAATLSLANFQYTVGGSVQSTMVAVVGRCVGAKEKEQAKHYVRVLLGGSYLMIAATDLLLCLFSTPLLGLFGLTPESTDLSRVLLIYHSAVSVILWPAAFCLPPAFRAANDVMFTMVTAIFSMWFFRVAAAYFLALETVSVFGLFTLPGMGLGLMGVWYAMTADWIFRTALFLWRLISGRWLARSKIS
ncbi:MAG: MATE family efflux transporter [Clostridia bacterium]|nr:MATE family efflux transporter [Clostridia bacterium]MBQ8511865.1 MATE family efflux transporter [Clostridia bacterium]